jgi:transcriptional regulator with XRE-family HTH domain
MQRTSADAPLATIAAALRRERERAGISLAELARRARLAKSTLSQLEAGAGNPSVETLWSLGVALGVPLSRLVEPAAPTVRVVRAGEGPAIRSQHADFAGRLLAAGAPIGRHDLYTIELEPGQIRQAQPHNAGTVEHLVLASGRIRVGPQASPVELDPGDYVAFAGDEPHCYEALAPATWGVLMMQHK